MGNWNENNRLIFPRGENHFFMKNSASRFCQQGKWGKWSIFQIVTPLVLLLWIYTKPKQNGSTFLFSLWYNSSLLYVSFALFNLHFIFPLFLSHCFKSFSNPHLGITSQTHKHIVLNFIQKGKAHSYLTKHFKQTKSI